MHALLQAFQAEDFQGILEAMHGMPVTIRLMDPPLHEFLPKVGSPALIKMAKDMESQLGISSDEIMSHVDHLQVGLQSNLEMTRSPVCM